MKSKIKKIIILLLISHSILAQINSGELSLSEKYKTILININKSFIVDVVNDDYLKKESIFIKESDITVKNYEKRNLALNSIKSVTTNKDTIYYCNRGLIFNENQIALNKINNTIINSNFENPNIKKIELLKSLIEQIEGLSNLEEGTKLNERKKELINLCKNFSLISKIKLDKTLIKRYNKAEIDYFTNELLNLPILNENESLKNEKIKLLEIYQNYESKIEKLKKELEGKVEWADNPSSAVRDEIYDNFKNEYRDYPYLVDVIEKSKKQKTAFRNEFSMPKTSENNKIITPIEQNSKKNN